jgi:hypothetical protein
MLSITVPEQHGDRELLLTWFYLSRHSRGEPHRSRVYRLQQLCEENRLSVKKVGGRIVSALHTTEIMNIS